MKGLKYLIELKDKMSEGLGKSVKALQDMREKALAAKSAMSNTSKSVSDLRDQIESLRAKRDIIPSSEIDNIRKMNLEIGRLTKQMNNLETAKGSGLKGFVSGLWDEVPDFLKNPAVLASVVGLNSINLSQGWETGMAKINTTARLSKEELIALSNELRAMGENSSTSLEGVPMAFESIISQVGDVQVSMDIMRSSLRGAQAGFTDVGTVSAALAQSLSAIGTQNASASEVLDTLFAAKRVGAGEFKDFASYVPGLIAQAKGLGIGYRDVAGAFAYMTSKGNDASSSAMLIGNAFSAMAKGDVWDAMKAAGISMFDATGKMRPMLDIMTDISDRMRGMSNESKAKFLEGIKLTDAQARQGFITLTSDIDKLSESMTATASPVGEMNSALGESNTFANQLTQTMNYLKSVQMSIGEFVIPLLSKGLSGINVLFGLISANANIVKASLLGVAAAFIVIRWNAIKSAIAMAYSTIITYAQAAANFLLGLSVKAIGIGMIVTAISVLVYWMIHLWNTSETFRGTIMGVFEVMKAGWSQVLELVAQVRPFLSVAWAVMKAVMGYIWDAIKTVFGLYWDMYTAIIKGMMDIADPIVDMLRSIFPVIDEVVAKFKKGFAKGKIEIAAKPAGTSGAGSTTDPLTGGPTGGTVTDPGLRSVSAGGAKPTTINISIGKFQDKIEIHTTQLQQGVDDAVRIVEEALLRTINGINQAY